MKLSSGKRTGNQFYEFFYNNISKIKYILRSGMFESGD
jgi:hypothetical protein